MRTRFIVFGFIVLGFLVLVATAVLPIAVVKHGNDASDSSELGVGKRASTILPAATAPSSRPPLRPGREAFVGSESCASCHLSQAAAYRGSHHARALVTPDADRAQAQLANSQFTSTHGGTTAFTLSDGKPVVSTPTADGKSATFSVKYVSGVWPLEQYVVATERGKLQALGVVWDSRTTTEQGKRWFHVYGADGIAPSDSLFFTAAAQNWNHMCAECHSTWVERRYDANADSFDTRWAELSVGCEACHGPGAEHVRSAKAAMSSTAVEALPVRLKASEPWTPSATGSPLPRAQDGVEVEVCAPCHSRREPLKEAFLASDPFLDSFEPELLLPGRYHADGQVEGEVYEWGSFVQSRMYQMGVKCSDCHDSHSGKLRAQDDQLCVRCHEPARFAVESHSHHTFSKAPRCIDCHMPPSTFMQIDERRDHSIRIPRPDHSVAFGTPNACNGCHADKSAAWASDEMAKWFPAASNRPHFVDALSKDRTGSLDALHALRKVAEESSFPAIARATALERLGHYPAQQTLKTLRAAVRSSDPLVVYGAVLGSAQLPLQSRTSALWPALTHTKRAVRVAAAKLLAGVRVAELPADDRLTLERAFAEVMESFDVSASRAETHVERSGFELARGRVSAAESSLQMALRLQPCLAEAHLNLAEVARQRGDEAAAEQAIRTAIVCQPVSAAAHHALGLWQVRARQLNDAVASLKKAVELAPADARFRYVLAVALHGNNARDEAIRVLETTLEKHPNDANALQALASYLREAGQNERAAEVQRKLEVLVQE